MGGMQSSTSSVNATCVDLDLERVQDVRSDALGIYFAKRALMMIMRRAGPNHF